MIVEDEQDVEDLEDIVTELQRENTLPYGRGLTFDELLTSTREIEDADIHYGLRGDLIEHLWALKRANIA